MKKKYLFLSLFTLCNTLFITSNEVPAQLTEQIQFLQKETQETLKAWQKALVQENLLLGKYNENINKTITSQKGMEILTTAKKISSKLPESTKNMITKILDSKSFKDALNKKTDEELEKISSKNSSFNAIKGETTPSQIFSSPAIQNSKVLNLLYTAQATRAHYQLLWQKLTAKTKELAAQMATIKEVKPSTETSNTAQVDNQSEQTTANEEQPKKIRLSSLRKKTAN